MFSGAWNGGKCEASKLDEISEITLYTYTAHQNFKDTSNIFSWGQKNTNLQW